jgi:tellurite resistance protein TehA-like permease
MSQTAIAAFPTAPSQPARRRVEIVRQFTPNWFTVTMGTGILALALNQAPFVTPAIRLAAEGLWMLNILLFTLFAGLYAARWILFFHEA